jgi:hypothetical protein
MASLPNGLLGGGGPCKRRGLVGGSDVTGGGALKGRLMASLANRLLGGGGPCEGQKTHLCHVDPQKLRTQYGKPLMEKEECWRQSLTRRKH